MVLFGCSEWLNFHPQFCGAVFSELVVFSSQCTKGYTSARKLLCHDEVQV